MRNKSYTILKNGRLLSQSPSPLEHVRKNNPATLCQASLIPGYAWSFFSHPKYHPLGNADSFSSTILVSSRKTARERVSSLLLF